jgi:hypothetical protein
MTGKYLQAMQKTCLIIIGRKVRFIGKKVRKNQIEYKMWNVVFVRQRPAF